MKLMCKLFGHKWEKIKQLKREDSQTYIEKCKRCNKTVVSTYNAWGNILIISLSDFDDKHVRGGMMDNKRISEIGDEEMIKQDAQFGLMHYLQLEGMMSKEKCQTCGKDFEVNHDFFSMLYPFCSIECWDNYTKYEVVER